MREKRAMSYLMLISSMLIFGTIGIFRRYIPLSSGSLALARGLMGALFIVVFTKIKGRKSGYSSIDKKKLILLIVSGMMMGINWMLLFEAYNYTTVATATLCYYMQPTIVILLSPLIFREKLTVKKIVCAVIAMVGMVFVSGMADGGSVQSVDMKGIVFGISAAFVYAGIVILNKKVQIEDAYTKTIIQLFSAAVVMVPYLLLTEDFGSVSLNTTSIIMLLVVGIVHTGIAYVLYFGSINGLNVQSIAVLSYIDPVSALFFSFLILHESMTVYGMIGAVLIIGSALCSEICVKSKKI